MPRCAPPAAAVPLLAGLVLAAAGVHAQSPRNFPATALRGEVVVLQPPQIALNGRPARLAPGARIRSAGNMLQMSGELVGQRLAVHYTLDLAGDLLDVWVLTPQELARRPWPTTPQQAQAWRFDPASQTWSPQ
jgi:hypothetical protein